MAKKALIAVVIILVVAAAGYWYFFMPKTIDQRFGELGQIYAKYGVDLKTDSAVDSPAMNDLSYEELIGLKADLTDFKGKLFSQEEEVNSAVDMYISITDYLLKYDEANVLNSQITDFFSVERTAEEACTQVDASLDYLDLKKSLLEDEKNIVNSIFSFSDDYPEAEKQFNFMAELAAFNVDADEAEITNLEYDVGFLVENC